MQSDKNMQMEKRVAYSLERLYESYGYRKFKMSSFEEYSMYSDNSDFLISKKVITFTGLDGKLMALRPDVTLSVIKNSKDGKFGNEKVFYNEKVYREFGKTKEFREIRQAGVEFIGKIDYYAYAELILLALKSLERIDKNYVLDISFLSLVTSLIDGFKVTGQVKQEFYEYLKSKNIDDFTKSAVKNGLTQKEIDAFICLAKINSNLSATLVEVKKAIISEQMQVAFEELSSLVTVLEKLPNSDKINVNFSITGNLDYYTGLIFNGYVSGVPKSVLSGGRYDKLLEKLGKNNGAIGFAVYLGELERYFADEIPVTDMLILYDDAQVDQVLKIVEQMVSEGKSVRADTRIPTSFKYKKLYRIIDGQLKEIEND